MKPEDLPAIYGLLPGTARALIDALGVTHACALLNARPGCEIRVPKHADRHPEGTRRWAELVGIVGTDGTQALATHWGGEILDVPTCDQARREIRHRAIRAEFDRLTTEAGLSGRQAIYEIGLQYAPISSRAIEMICGRADVGQADVQAELF